MIDSQELEIRIEQTRKALIKLLNKKLNAQSGGFFVPLAGNASWSKKPEWSSVNGGGKM
jgi:hypothetical protein